MENDNEKIEIIDDDTSVNVDNEQSTIVGVPEEESVIDKTQVLDTRIDKKELRKQEKLRKQENKKSDVNASSNVYDNEPINIVETAVTKGSSGSEVIGNINGETITPTNNPIPSPIDITVKQKVNNKNNNKKVKVVSKRERIVSIIVSIFVIIVLGGAGYAAYYFGYKTNPSRFEIKNIYLELGDELPSAISYYVSSANQLDDMEYTLDISNVAQNSVGSYTYSVKHKNVTKTAQVIVRDTKSPKITIKDKSELVFKKDSKVTKDDIVLSCEDISNCTYKTEYEVSTENPGDKEITVIARDDSGNESREVVTIRIVDIQKILVCTSKETVSEDNSYSVVNIDTLSFDSNDYVVLKSGVKQYTYSDYSAYFAKLKELQDNERYIFNRTNFTYTEENDVENTNLTKYDEIMNFYTDKGYTCK